MIYAIMAAIATAAISIYVINYLHKEYIVAKNFRDLYFRNCCRAFDELAAIKKEHIKELETTKNRYQIELTSKAAKLNEAHRIIFELQGELKLLDEVQELLGVQKSDILYTISELKRCEETIKINEETGKFVRAAKQCKDLLRQLLEDDDTK